MNIVKSSLLVLVLLSLSYSAYVSISGIVTDTAGVAISGALVKLLAGGQTAITGTDGRFTLLGNNVGITAKPAQSQSYQPAVSLSKGILKVHIQELSSITIRTYNLQGCLLTTMRRTLSAGDHSMALSDRSWGVYVYKVEVNGKGYQVMGNGYTAAVSTTTQGTSEYSQPKQGAALTAISDTLWVWKNGYYNYLLSVHTSDTIGIAIKMHKLLISPDADVTDVDGNVYHTVKIGTQTWTVENLKTTHYNDGTAIPNVTDTMAWINLTTGAYCWYDNDTTYKSPYGALYNWYAVNTGKLAPAGWHVPTNAEWDTLSVHLGGGSQVGGVLKEAGTTHWISPNTGATNSIGFSALPGGYRYFDNNPNRSFGGIGIYGFWWDPAVGSVTLASYHVLLYDYSGLGKGSSYKSSGRSVRLVRD